MGYELRYRALPTMDLFHHSKALYRGIMGPIASGKSVGCSMEIFRLMINQGRMYDGVRRSRFAVIRNCYDEETEVLTERGWLLFKDLRGDDRVASLVEGGMEFQVPSYFYSSDYVGEMIGFKNEGIDFRVTPDHRLLVSLRNARKKEWSSYRFRKASECYGKTNMRVMRDVSMWDGINCGLSEDMFEWLGYWFAEGVSGVKEYNGSIRHNCIIISKNDIGYAHKVFRKAGLPYSAIRRDDGYYAFRLRVTEGTRGLIVKLSKCGKALTKSIPFEWKNAPRNHLRRFIKGYLQGDGCHSSNGVIVAHTSSLELANDLQEIGLRAGYVVNINDTAQVMADKVVNGVLFHQNRATISVTFLKELKYRPCLRSSGRYKGWYKEQYSGKVYCVEVVGHIIYVRREGRAFWCSQTYGELRDTTLKTFLMWFPEGVFGRMNNKEMVYYMYFPYKGEMIQSEILFRALDRPDDVRKLLSMELSGAWVNEAREVPKAVIDVIGDRVERFPPEKMGGVTQPSVIMDTNPPDSDHWWYKLAEEKEWRGVRLDDGQWKFFKQPGALKEVEGKFMANENAENLENLSRGIDFYLSRVSGKSVDYVRTYYCGQYGFVIDGKPVIHEYKDEVHCSKEILKGDRRLVLYVGLDFGLTPAAIFAQRTSLGQWLWIDELCAEDMGISRFAEILKPKLLSEYEGYQIEIYGDPAGEARAQTDEMTPFMILEGKGLAAKPAPTNDFTLRREAIATACNRMVEGKPGFLISSRCKMARKGLMGGYHYKRVQVSGAERYQDKPDKGPYSHPVEAGGYAMMGAGEGDRLLDGKQEKIVIGGEWATSQMNFKETGWMVQ